MYDQYSFTPRHLFIILIKLSLGVPQFTVGSFKDGCAELFEMQADKKCLSVYSLFACLSDAVVT